MREEVAASLFDHRAFLAKLRRRPGLISSASPSEVQATLRLLGLVLRGELGAPDKTRRALRQLPNASRLERLFVDGRSLRGLVSRSAKKPEAGRKVLKEAGRALPLALTIFSRRSRHGKNNGGQGRV